MTVGRLFNSLNYQAALDQFDIGFQHDGGNAKGGTGVFLAS